MGKLMAADVPQPKRDELKQQLDLLQVKLARKEVGLPAFNRCFKPSNRRWAIRS